MRRHEAEGVYINQMQVNFADFPTVGSLDVDFNHMRMIPIIIPPYLRACFSRQHLAR